MAERLIQIKKHNSPEDLRDHLRGLDVELAVAEEVDPAGVLGTPTSFVDGSAGRFEVANRFAVLPMEGWDATDAGAPTDLVRRRWQRFGSSGAGLVWAEATAVTAAGRANPNQLVLTPENQSGFAELRELLDSTQVCGLQLTHSGRYARPTADGPAPRTLYAHPLLDQRVGAGDHTVLSDDEIDELVATFVAAAAMAADAGFDFVDVKACHGYLGHEFLTAHDRPGRYGGDLAGRTNFLRSVVEGIREARPSLGVALRLSIYDLVPFVAGPDRTGEPEVAGGYRYAFGGDGSGVGVDLAETHELLEIVEGLGIGLLSATAGSPYYCPHAQRPAYFPPSDGYGPPEDPLVGVARLLNATAELTRSHPALTMVGSGYTYLQQWLAHVGQAVIADGGAHMVGLGRMALSYPHLPADVLSGRTFEKSLVCRTFSDCTTAPRNGLISGCFPLDPFYKEHPARVELTQAKRAMRASGAD